MATKVSYESASREPAPNHSKQMLIFSLACRCPAVEQPECILAEARNLSMRERYDWVSTLTEDQLEMIYQSHHQCLNRQSSKHSLRKIHARTLN